MDTSEFIYGRNPIISLLKKSPERIAKIYIRQSAHGGSIEEIRNLSSQNRIPFQEVPGTKLNQLVGSVNDQGIVAQISAGSYIELEDWLETIDISKNPVVLLLDEIEDAHNFGAIVRSAAAAGLDGIIVSKHRQAPLNATVYKTSAGTIDLIPVIRVTNLSQSLPTLKEEGFWVCGLDQEANETLWEKDLQMPLVVVIGNESRGVRPVTRKQCDFMVSIPMAEEVESLNASVSASLLSYEILRQRQSKGKG